MYMVNINMNMNTHSLNAWSDYELIMPKEDDPFSRLTSSPDFCWGDWLNDNYFDAIPLMESFPDPAIMATMTSQLDTTLWRYGGDGAMWNELDPLFEPADKQTLFLQEVQWKEETKKIKEEKLSGSKLLSLETISKYYYMPITQAAKELNVGLTLLKKRCRELKIHRWPHRKLMSYVTLINHLHRELDKAEGEGSRKYLRAELERLEGEKKRIEQVPDIQMEDTTRRLRQTCFKANYKKRKQMAISDVSPTSSANLAILDSSKYSYQDYDDEIKYLLLSGTCSTVQR